MTQHRDVAKAFFERVSLRVGNMYTDGKFCFSYGEHFPIAAFVNDTTILLNEDKYSSTTSKHQGEVRRISGGVNILTCTTAEIKGYLDHQDEPIILTKREAPTQLSTILDYLKDYMRSKNVTKFPRKMFEDKINEMIMVANI